MIKPKLISVVVGAIAFALTQPGAQARKPLSLPGQLQVPPKQLASTSPSVVVRSQPPLIAQAPPANPLSSLNLSAAQEAQIRRIDALIQAQVKNVLTPDQWSELQSLQSSGASKGAALAKLNLAPDQITQLKEIEAIAQQRLLSILNAEQKKQLQKGPLPSPATAPAPSPSPTGTAPTTPPSSPPSALAALNLTTEQQAQVQQVQALAQAQIQTILSPDQQKQLQTLQSANLSQSAALQQLNLTGNQKSQLQEVESLAQQRILSILTAEQKKKLLTP
ncbi:hypothetical protein [Acaryochloris marina]|uniref:Uncharacterized protein n=1 Tax=Acaryochloris marina (strain MBIC 11017) TaxID=329726 RepID=B0C6K0_ACAM1|nr:hypothetical protein [Acaryochloris marina]ABW26421.1 hypothetical protein AM1_1390 [Acaryochloris marina MBIC11017]BDM81235.1 hypothetical protein AM10699_41020 [Acaryochloris marina MBIC10699]